MLVCSCACSCTCLCVCLFMYVCVQLLPEEKAEGHLIFFFVGDLGVQMVILIYYGPIRAGFI